MLPVLRPLPLALLSTLLIPQSVGAGAGAGAGRHQPFAQHSQGQVIVKLAVEGPHAVGECAEVLARDGRSFATATADRSRSLDGVHQHLRVRSIRALFRNANARPFAAQRRALRERFEAAQRRYRRGPTRGRRRMTPLPDLAHVYLVRFPEEVPVAEAVALYGADPHVEFAQPNYAVAAVPFVPDDPFLFSSGSWGQPFPDLWGLDRIRVEGAWVSSLGEDVVVGVVDTGIDPDHPDLADNVWINEREDLNGNGLPDPNDRNGIDDDRNGYVDDVFGFDFHNDVGAYPFDDYGHGTHIAGTIAAVGANGIGVVGVAPRARILAAKALGANGSGSIANLAAGLVYAAENGAAVINNSWSCSSRCPENPLAEDAVRLAHALGAVLIFSAGNKTDQVLFFSPQNMHETVVVAALDPADQVAGFSNFGFLVDVIAPGSGLPFSPPTTAPSRGILSLRSSGTAARLDGGGIFAVAERYLRMSGTSMSAPHVSGLAALVRGRHPVLGPDDVRNLLRLSAEDLGPPGHDRETGAGVVDASFAVGIERVPHLRGTIVTPRPRAVLRQQDGPIEVVGTAAGRDLNSFDLSVGSGASPTRYDPLVESTADPVQAGVLGTWDAAQLPDGPYVLRLRLHTVDGLRLEEFAEVSLERNPPTLLSPEGVSATGPRVSGNLVIWESPGGDGATDLFLHDGSAREATRLVDAPGDQEPSGLSEVVVWKDGRRFPDTPFEILSCAFERRRGAACNEIPISIGIERTRGQPALSGRRVVWPDDRDGLFKLYSCRVDVERSSCSDRVLAPGPASQVSPAIDGDRVVWLDLRPGSVELHTCAFAADTGDCPARAVGTGSLLPLEPAISGDLIAWLEAGIDLRLCALDPESALCPSSKVASPGTFTQPALSGRRMVWHERTQEGGLDVFFCEYDRSANRCPAQRLTAHPATQQHPAIDGTRVVWEDFRNGTAQVASLNLPALEPIGDRSVLEGRPLHIGVRAIVPSDDEVRLRVELVGAGSVEAIGAQFRELPNGRGHLHWQPAYDQAGRYLLRFSATTRGQLRSEETIWVEVIDFDAPPGSRKHPL